jgi:hypothetical protein
MTRLVEVGVGDAQRATRLIRVALRFAPGAVDYTGIDLFEDSDDPGCVPLIDVHRDLAGLGAKIRLIPGEPAAALASVANALANSDLLLLSASVSDEAVAGMWFYLPRMLHAGSIVLRERLGAVGEPTFEVFTPREVQTKAEQATLRQAA